MKECRLRLTWPLIAATDRHMAKSSVIPRIVIPGLGEPIFQTSI